MVSSTDWEMPFCAICSAGFDPDEDQVWVDAKLNRANGETEAGEYVLHSGCWERLTEGWIDPP